MISESKIRGLVEEKIAGTENYLVDVRVKAGNRIKVFLDNFSNLSIKDCVEVSRHIEGKLDRETEDFDLEVSSPGLTEPFKVKQQYRKYLGKEVTVLTREGQKVSGKLFDVGEDDFKVLEAPKKKKAEAKQWNFKYDDVKETKVVISFK